MNIITRAILIGVVINSPSKALRKVFMWFPARRRKSRNYFTSTSDLDLLTLMFTNLMLVVSKVSKLVTLRIKESYRLKLDSVPWSSDLMLFYGLDVVQLRCYSFTEGLGFK